MEAKDIAITVIKQKDGVCHELQVLIRATIGEAVVEVLQSIELDGYPLRARFIKEVYSPDALLYKVDVNKLFPLSDVLKKIKDTLQQKYTLVMEI
jgi:hypothetical protein